MRILSDFCDLLDGTNEAHFDVYMYTISTEQTPHAAAWDQVVIQPTYYPFHDDVDCLESQLPALLSDMPPIREFIEIGPGSATAVIAKSIPAASLFPLLQSYKCIDYSAQYASAAANLVKHHFGAGLEASAMVGDFFATNSKAFDIHSPPLVFCVGNTLCNISGSSTRSIFDALRTRLLAVRHLVDLHRGYFVVTHDINQDVEQIIAAYSSQLFSAQYIELIKTIAKECRGLTSEGFVYRCVYYPEEYYADFGVVAEQAQNITVLGRQFTIEKGKFLALNRSYKLLPIHIRQAALEVGFGAPQTRVSSSGRTALHFWATR